MGARFHLRHANIVAYLTHPDAPCPRLKASELSDFLMALAHSGYFDEPVFVSGDPSWPALMQERADRALRRFDRWEAVLVSASLTRDVLSELRIAFREYDFYALAICSKGSHDELNAQAAHFAYRSGDNGLVLIPVAETSADPLTVLDPVSSFATAIEARGKWPGFLFWSRSGLSAFASLVEASDLFERLIAGVRGDSRAGALLRMLNGDSVDDALRSYRVRSAGVRLLHLSDLHYGRKEAAENEALLLAHMETQLDTIDRVVITGDLFDNPSRADAVLARNFRAALVRRSGRDPVVVPGNHDQKWLGNIPSDMRQVSDLEWSSLVLDDHNQIAFTCFDSARDASVARGRVTAEQRRDVATLFETQAVKNPKIREYLPVALVHHHPFTFETTPETVVQRILGKFGLSDETFLRMVDADELIQWLARRRIPLVLHGHKHVQRHHCESVDLGGTASMVTAIGCGASLGADGYPLTYNIVTWDAAAKSWTASFFADPGDGSGFVRQLITSNELQGA